MCKISAGVGKESPSLHNWYSREINQGPVNWPKGLGEDLKWKGREKRYIGKTNGKSQSTEETKDRERALPPLELLAKNGGPGVRMQ